MGSLTQATACEVRHEVVVPTSRDIWVGTPGVGNRKSQSGGLPRTLKKRMHPVIICLFFKSRDDNFVRVEIGL